MADNSQEQVMKRTNTRSSASYMALRQESGAFRIERGETETSDPLFLGVAQEQGRAERLLDWWLEHDLDVEAATHLNGSSTRALMALMLRAAEETVTAPVPVHRDSTAVELSDGRTTARRLPDAGFVELSNSGGKIFLSPADLADIRLLTSSRLCFPIAPLREE